MLMKRIVYGVALAIALPLLVAAQPALTGKWQGKTGGSAQLVVLDVIAKGTALTGTLTINNETSKIADGKVSKNTFAFKATVDGMTDAGFSGEIGTDRVRLWPDSLGADRAVILTRPKAQQ
jgi:hypothetical protein